MDRQEIETENKILVYPWHAILYLLHALLKYSIYYADRI